MYVKNDIVRIKTGETCMIIGIPGTFLSNGAYEALVVELGPGGKYIPVFKKGKKINKWLQISDIAYSLTDTDKTESIDNYLEIEYHGQVIEIKPKNHSNITFEEDKNGFKCVKIHYQDHLHNLIEINLEK